MDNEIKRFNSECEEEIRLQGHDQALKDVSMKWLKTSGKFKYSYHFSWMGRPIIQLPQDMIAMQELIWKVKPDVIIETGIAHGGSLIYYSSLIELLGNKGVVIGVDLDIREHNRVEIEKHPMVKNIKMIQGSSTDQETINIITDMIKPNDQVMVLLDSCHTHAHVLKELELYSDFVKKGSYLICFDTLVEHIPDEFNGVRPWRAGNNPMTAVREFLQNNDRFQIDEKVHDKLLITCAPNGYLKCVKD